MIVFEVLGILVALIFLFFAIIKLFLKDKKQNEAEFLVDRKPENAVSMEDKNFQEKRVASVLKKKKNMTTHDSFTSVKPPVNLENKPTVPKKRSQAARMIIMKEILSKPKSLEHL